ncbi:MAG TPA: hypothetical protein VF796_02660, partial [Humisphaera sp.]
CPSRVDERFDWVPGRPTAGVALATAADTKWGYDAGEELLDVQKRPFSYGYNDWGAGNPQGPSIVTANQRGLGGDLFGSGKEMPMSRVRAPSEMIAIGDNVPDGSYDFNIDPENAREAPSPIHNKGANMLYVDGHVMWSPQQDLVLFDVKTNVAFAKTSGEWRRVAPHWNIDNQP